MGRVRKTRKVQKILRESDDRVQQALKVSQALVPTKRSAAPPGKSRDKAHHIEEIPLSMFLKANLALGPPFRILLDTNFINFSIQHKIDLFQGLMDCFLAKCIPYVTDCVAGELEKMGHRYRLALKLAHDPRIVRLTCDHPGTYADDCIVRRVTNHRCYVVGTSDKNLKLRLRKIPGVPIVYVAKHKYELERLPEVAL
uniref:rRNA-processing protein FCF1-like n=1 Tax=Dermatophagoides pteronyssinus TaxID=6956 RepID=A0A6P6Y517_DERPT|nr:rRNA-processing protein FCF1-like [Dermatophagoides pteronyssinus]